MGLEASCHPRLSICIVNWNTCSHLRACLRSILSLPPQVPYEVIVVDNASQDGSREMVEREFPQVRLIANAENRGYAEANNQAFAMAQGEYLLLLNPDTEVLPTADSSPQCPRSSLQALVEFLDAHPEAGAVGPQLRYPDGRIQPSCRSFPAPGPLLWDFLGLGRLFPRNRLFGAYRMTYWGHDTEREVDQPMGSCLLLRRRALEEVGPFDPQFRIFFNEVDLCYRLKQAGWRIYFTPQARFLHHVGKSTHQVWPKMVRESEEGLVRFYAKHYRQRYPYPLYALFLLLFRLAYRIRYWRARSRERACPPGGH